MRWLLRQGADLLAYWLLPLLCFVLPARAANAVARVMARRGWFFRAHAANALANVSRVAPVADPEAWKTTFRLVQFLDAVDTWHGHFSSDRRIARALVSGPEAWPEAGTVVMLGTHLGPGTLFLRCLAAAGWAPRFVFRDVPDAARRGAPVFHAYLRWRVAYLRKVCRGGEIRVPGGRDAVAAALDQPGGALVLLLDAPAERPCGTRLRLRGQALPIDPRGLQMVVDHGAPASLFVMRWDATLGRRRLEVTPAEPVTDCDQALTRMEAFLDEALASDSAQWQLWLTAEPVLAGGD